MDDLKENAERLPAILPGRDVAVPDYIKEGTEGLENVEPRDVMYPRAVLLQALSPSVIEGRGPEFIAGAVSNSMTGEIWLKKNEVINFVPVYHFKQWIRWGDRDAGESILDSSDDPASELAMSARDMRRRPLDSGREVVDVTEYHNFVALFPVYGPHKLLVISCARTNHKKGRLLLGLAQYRQGRPLFAGQYEVSTVLETNRRGQQYYVYNFRNAGWCSKELYPAAEALYASFRELRMAQVDWKGEQAAATDADGETEM